MRLKRRHIEKHTSWSYVFSKLEIQYNTHPVHSARTCTFRVYHTVAVAGVQYCMWSLTCVVSRRLSLTFCCIHENIDSVAVVAQELKHSLKQLAPATVAQRVWCAVKALKEIFQGREASTSCLEKHELLCLYKLARCSKPHKRHLNSARKTLSIFTLENAEFKLSLSLNPKTTNNKRLFC